MAYSLKPFVRSELLGLSPRRKTRPPALLNLSSNELLHPDADAFWSAAISRDGRRVTRYPAYDDVTRAVARFQGVPAERVLLTAGSEDAIRVLLTALHPASHRLILQVPNYEGWAHHAALQGLQVSHVSFGALVPDKFRLEAFGEALSRTEPALVVVSNPNAPTGFWFSSEEMTALAAMCQDYGHLLLIDECYLEFSNISHLPLLELDNVIQVRTFSKAYGMAGARVASVVLPAELASYVARWAPQFSISGLSLELVLTALAESVLFARIRAELLGWQANFIQEVRERFGWHPLPTACNFVNLRVASPDSARWVTARLLQGGIRIRCTTDLEGLSGCIRLTAADPERMQRVMHALDAVVGAED